MKIKIGQTVYHDTYGKGEVTSIIDKQVIVSFDKEYEIVNYNIIDEPYYFDDRTFLEKTNLIKVSEDELDYITHCHTCEEHLDSRVERKCPKCSGLLCSCGSCMCNYKGIPRKRTVNNSKI